MMSEAWQTFTTGTGCDLDRIFDHSSLSQTSLPTQNPVPQRHHHDKEFKGLIVLLPLNWNSIPVSKSPESLS